MRYAAVLFLAAIAMIPAPPLRHFRTELAGSDGKIPTPSLGYMRMDRERSDRAVPAPSRSSRMDVARSDRKTVAVLSFDNNSGKPDYDPLGKGIAAMMITDLSAVPSVQVVEREKVQDLIGEMQMQQTALFDARTAARLGKLVGAQYVVTGAVMAIDPRIRLDTRVIRVETGEIVKTAQVTGDEQKFFDLQQRLSKQLISDLDVALSPEEAEKLRQQQEAEKIEDLQVQLEYSQALDLFDRKMYVESAEKMGSVVRKAPESSLVRASYKLVSERARATASAKGRQKLGGWLKSKIDR